MSKNPKNALVPKLRFPDFENDQNWDAKLLGEISEIVRGGSPRPIEDFLTTNFDGLNWLKIGDVAPDAKYIANTKERVIKGALKNTREVYPGDLILSNSMSFGRPYILKIKSCIHDGWIAIRSIIKEVDTDYLYYFISTEDCQQYFSTNAAGAAVKNLNAEIIKLLPVRIPALKEQQKIADCLSSLDELITAENRKLEALQQHKKGLMQQLFPAEGEKVPRFRFKEFRDEGDWEEKTLGQLIEIKGRIGYRGYTTEDIVREGEGAISLSPSNISDDGVLSFDKSTYISWAKYYESPEIILQEGYTVLVKTGSSYGRTGLIRALPIPTTINPQIVVLKPKKIDEVFLYLLVSNTGVQKQIDATVVGGAIPTLSQESVTKFEVLVPNLDEQQMISNCLSYVDNLINAQSLNVEVLKSHKKGLMQQLFPNVTSTK